MAGILIGVIVLGTIYAGFTSNPDEASAAQWVVVGAVVLMVLTSLGV